MPNMSDVPQRTISDSDSHTTAAATTPKADDILAWLRDYAREKPEVAALWCFGIGFVLGWKLKLW